MKSIVLFLCVLMVSLFTTVCEVYSEQIGSELNNNFPKKTGNINDKTDIPNISNQDIFGDEQSFPFIAGLGKNAAH